MSEGKFHLTQSLPIQVANSYIHVTKVNSLTKGWLTFMGISPDRIIEGTVVADKLVVGEMGACGSPSIRHMDWLRNGIHNRLGHPPMRKKILFVERVFDGAGNSNEIWKSIQDFAAKKGWDTYLQTSHNLASLEHQIGNFSDSAIIVAPHGGGSALLMAAQPKACFIEMLSPGYRFQMMYGEIAGRLSIEYFGLLMDVSPEIILDTIQRCFIYQELNKAKKPFFLFRGTKRQEKAKPTI